MSTERVALIPRKPLRLPSPEDPGGRGSLLRVCLAAPSNFSRRPVRPLTHQVAHRMFEWACQAAGSAATLHALRP